MRTMVLLILVLALLVSVSGCVFHFKAKEIETDMQRQRVFQDSCWELERVTVGG